MKTNTKRRDFSGKSQCSGSAPDYYDEQLRLLRGAGWIAHAKEFENCVRALRVIHTWASVDGALVPEHVKKLSSKALKPFMPNVTGEREQNNQRSSG